MKKQLIKTIFPLIVLPLMSISAIAQENAVSFETPMQAVLADNNFVAQTELATISLTQTLNRGESADKIMITLTESGLMDDAIAAIKTTYFIKQNKDAMWIIDEKFETRKCRRGEDAGIFTSKRCL